MAQYFQRIYGCETENIEININEFLPLIEKQRIEGMEIDKGFEMWKLNQLLMGVVISKL